MPSKKRGVRKDTLTKTSKTSKNGRKAMDDPEDVSFESPNLTKAERAKADAAFMKFRKAQMAKLTPEDLLFGQLLHIRFLTTGLIDECFEKYKHACAKRHRQKKKSRS